MSGVFIVIEGPDGSGTTTHAGLLAERLKNLGYDVLSTHEPTKGPIGVFIRQQLQSADLSSSALQMLFSADRAWHNERMILPGLEKGQIVICDRYSLSTILYGKALGLDEKWLTQMNSNFTQPAVQILAFPSLDTCLRRVRERSSRDILEEEELQRKVYDAYASFAQDSSAAVIDTDQDMQHVADLFYDAVKPYLPKS